MFEYILLFLAVFCFAGQFLLTKLYERSVKQAFITSLSFFAVSGLVNVILFLAIGGFKVGFTGFSLIISLITSVVYLLYQVISIKILSLGNVSIYSMFMMLGGMALPVVYGVGCLGEPLGIYKIIGLILLTFALVFQVTGEKTNKSTKRLFYILCAIIFIINGLTGVLAKIHQDNPSAVSTESYLIIYNGISFVFGTALCCLFGFKNKGEKAGLLRDSLRKKPILVTVLCALASALGTFFLLIAALKTPASVQFPIISGGTIVFSVIGALLFYGEKPNKKGVICLVIAFVSTFLFMF